MKLSENQWIRSVIEESDNGSVRCVDWGLPRGYGLSCWAVICYGLYVAIDGFFIFDDSRVSVYRYAQAKFLFQDLTIPGFQDFMIT